MSELTRRFRREMNMLVVRMTVAEATAAQIAFDEQRVAAEADGTINAGNCGTQYKLLWAKTHHGADAVEQVPEGTLLEPIETAARPH